VTGLKVCEDSLVVRVWRVRAAVRGRHDILLAVELGKGHCTGAAALYGTPRLLRGKAGCLWGSTATQGQRQQPDRQLKQLCTRRLVPRGLLLKPTGLCAVQPPSQEPKGSSSNLVH
jgi:hypothetical protein